MNIIILTNHASSLGYGAEINMLTISKGLSDLGHNITMLYLKEGDLLEEYRKFCVHTMQVSSYELGGKKRFFGSLLNFISVINKLPKDKYHIVYANQIWCLPFAYILGFLKRLTLVCYQQEPVPEKIGIGLFISLRLVKRNIFVSNTTKLDWIKRGFVKENRAEVAYCGVNTEIFKPSEDFLKDRARLGFPKDGKIILYMGRLDKGKGIETLLEAFSLLLKKGIFARLLIVGSTALSGREYEESLIFKCVSLGIKEYMTFLGFKDNPIDFYQISDIVVVPSVFQEPFGRIVIESLACGTPVIASKIGGIPEILTGEFQQYLFTPGSSEELANLLIMNLNWREQDPALGKRCREYIISNFSAVKFIDRIEDILLF